MDRSQTRSPSDADAPLKGKAPAEDQLRDPAPEGGHPNDSYPVEGKDDWKSRPQQYPAAKDDIAQPDRKSRRPTDHD